MGYSIGVINKRQIMNEEPRCCDCCGYSGPRPLVKVEARFGRRIYANREARDTVYFCGVCHQSDASRRYVMGVLSHEFEIFQFVAQCTNRILDAMEADHE